MKGNNAKNTRTADKGLLSLENPTLQYFLLHEI